MLVDIFFGAPAMTLRKLPKRDQDVRRVAIEP
jgi:hypothetical protein